ncbi:hypothetical protein [Nonomuraea rubra]|uniref:hypothetical protein n=1 Tax=Nonomuraea rubra TaxID=46180 RepID=UPI0031ECC0D5
MQKDPRCSLYVASDDFRSFAVAEGEAELSPVSLEPGDEVGLEPAGHAAAARRPDARAGLSAADVSDRRLVIRLRVSRLYGTALAVS